MYVYAGMSAQLIRHEHQCSLDTRACTFHWLISAGGEWTERDNLA